ncbi:MAG: FAD-dependent oxidoreductase [Bradymonadia bacterium]
MSVYDVLIIGGGPGGRGVAQEAAARGLSVALVDEGEMLGGDGPHVMMGVLNRFALRLEEARNDALPGLAPTDLDLDAVWSDLKRRSRRAALTAAGEQVFALKRAGITVVRGHGTLAPGKRVQVGDQILEGRVVVHATGDRPRPLPATPVLDEGPVVSFEGLMALEQCPRHLVIAGGGPLGVSAASSFAALGVKVTLMHRHSRLLPDESPDISAELARMLVRRGVTVHLDAEVTEVESGEDGVRVTARTKGKSRGARGSHLLVAAGRQRPERPGLGLDPSPWPDMHLVGATAGSRGPFEASTQGRALGRRLVGELSGVEVRTKTAVPSMSLLRGRPEIGRVGPPWAALSERTDLIVGEAPLGALTAARVAGQPWGQVRVVAERAHGELLAVYAAGAEVEPILTAALPLMEMEATLHELIETPWPQSSWARALSLAAAHALSTLEGARQMVDDTQS